jgi:hypothetical protein
MPQHDTALLDTLRAQVDRARESGEYVERPWIGNDNLILRSGVTRFEVRYLIRQPARRSWEFPFGPELTAEELFDWLTSLR